MTTEDKIKAIVEVIGIVGFRLHASRHYSHNMATHMLYPEQVTREAIIESMYIDVIKLNINIWKEVA